MRVRGAAAARRVLGSVAAADADRASETGGGLDTGERSSAVALHMPQDTVVESIGLPLAVTGVDAGWRARGWPRSLLLLVLALAWAGLAFAQTRVVERYLYDAAGNIIGIDTEVIGGRPQVDALVPDRIFAGTRREFVLTGSNLSGATLATTWPGLSVVSFESQTDRISFTLDASEAALPGPAPLHVTTSAGAESVDILVRPALPRLLADPLPLTVAAGGGMARLALSLASPAAVDWTFEVSLADPAVATAAMSSFTVPAGALSVADGGLAITGGTAGSTRLVITIEGESLLDIGVVSTAGGGLPIGLMQRFSRPLGVSKQQPIVLSDRGPVVSALLGVNRATLSEAPERPVLTTAALLGVSRGALVTGVQPDVVPRDAGMARIHVAGFGLAAVDTVDLVPSDGIVVRAVAAAADGRTVAVDLDIAAEAALGERRVIARSGGTAIPSATTDGNRFYLAGELPRIDSISPIQLNPGQTADLTIRGVRFSATSEVRIERPDGSDGGVEIELPIEIAPDRIQARVQVASDAPAGLRRVRVVTAAGASSDVLTPANTLTVVTDELTEIPLVATRALSVFKPGPAGTPIETAAYGPILGVARGAVVSDVQPRLLETGRVTRLQVTGRGLDAVTEVTIAPAVGLAISAPVIAEDRIEVDVAVAADAELGIRAFEVAGPDGVLPTARADLAAIAVVAPMPMLEGVDPEYLLPGAPARQVTLVGRNFQQATAVRVLPQNDLVIGAFVVSGDGSRITLPISAGAAATLGPRTVVVETPAGATSSEPAVGNRLYIGDPQARSVNALVGPILGVQRAASPPVAAIPAIAQAPLLGVNRPFQTIVQTDRLGFAQPIGVARGPILFGVEPAIVVPGFEGDLILPGAEVLAGTTIAFEDGVGISIIRPAQVEQDAEGRRFVRVGIAVDPAAPAQSHRIRAENPPSQLDVAVEIPFADAQSGRLSVAGEQPIIQSISPVLALSGQQVVLRIRGLNLATATAVRLVPETGIAVGSAPTVSADGSELSVALDIDPLAEPGARLVQVVGPGGVSSEVADASNTLTIVRP